MTRKVALLLLLAMLFSMLVSCMDDTVDTTTTSSTTSSTSSTTTSSTTTSSNPPADETFTVTVVLSENITATTPLTVTVKSGENAVFKFKADTGYAIVSYSAGEYSNGTLTVKNVTKDMTINVSANIATEVGVRYHLNDGSGKKIVIQPDTTFYKTHNTLWIGQNSSLTRTGYALVEYNTKPDGTGEGISPGSKVTLQNGSRDLYCIWKRYTPTADFTFAQNTVKIQTGSSQSEGYVILSYNGNATEVVIPEKYNGKPVVQINTGAFLNVTSMQTLVLPTSLRKVQTGAFIGCSNLDTLYFPDTVYSIPDDAFDAATYSNLHHFYLNAAMAPRWTYTYDGLYHTKWDAVMSSTKKRVVMISGSSGIYGMNSEYLEKLLGDEYDVINFGTIRTTNASIYLEALKAVLNEDDIILYAPECTSIWQMGASSLATFKMFRDSEGMYNIYRNVDIANYTGYFAGITEFNSGGGSGNNSGRYSMTARDYLGYSKYGNTQNSGTLVKLTYPNQGTAISYSGDLLSSGKNNSGNFNGFSVSFDGYTYDLANVNGAADIADVADRMTALIEDVKATCGAKVYFAFCPVNESALTNEAKSAAAQAAYADMIAEYFGVEVIGTAGGHVFANSLFNAGDTHHLTNKGTVEHTYRLYLDLCEALGIDNVSAKTGHGSITGCEF